MTKKDVAVSKSALARALGCAPSSITHLIDRGLPVRRDGKVDRRAALEWIVDKTSGTGGGWSEQVRGKADLRARAERLLTGKSVACVKPSKAAAAVRTPGLNAEAESITGDLIRAVIVDTLVKIAAPTEALEFCRVALRAGCTPRQAYIMASWFCLQPSTNLDGIETEDLADANFKDPTAAQWRELLGSDFDFEAAEAEHDRITGPERAPAA